MLAHRYSQALQVLTSSAANGFIRDASPPNDTRSRGSDPLSNRISKLKSDQIGFAATAEIEHASDGAFGQTIADTSA